MQKGDEPGEFSIQGEDGKVWGLKSSSVRLEEHLGHTVTVTGSFKRTCALVEFVCMKFFEFINSVSGKDLLNRGGVHR